MARKGRRNTKGRTAPTLQVEELEPRLLLSADPVGVLASDTFTLEQTANEFVLDDNLELVNRSEAPAENEDQRLELVFVDRDTPDYQKLVDDLLTERNDGRSIEVFLLDDNRDGISQITDILAAFENLDAVHILSHGSEHGLQLGNTWVDARSIENYADEITNWQTAFGADGDLLLYGCDLAASQTGRDLIDALGEWTATDVAASNDLTGHELLGGDWQLEYQRGVLDTPTILSEQAQAQWHNLMAVSINSTSSATSAAADTNLTWSHSVASGNNRLLTVSMSFDGGGQSTGVTYDATPLTLVGRYISAKHTVELWQLTAPPEGPADIVASFSGSLLATGGGVAFNDVDQTTPTGTLQGAVGTSATPTINISSAPGEMVIDTVITDNASTLTTGANQAERWNLHNAGMDRVAAGSTEAGAASVTMSWSGAADDWTIVALTIKPLLAAPGPTVTTTTDNNDSGIVIGNLSHDIDWLQANQGADAKISLREAIIATNNTPNGATPDNIYFEITDPLVGGVHTIMVGAGGLPILTDPVVLDGTTDSDFSSTPIIELDGTGATGSSAGIWVRTSDSTVRGFIVHSFNDEGIEIDGTDRPANNNVVANNWVGIDETGTIKANLDDGILITDGASNNTIGGTGPNDGNVISGNAGDGILFRDNVLPGTSNNTVQGNLIGTDPTGLLDRGNTGAGIRIESGVDTSTIGTAGYGNVISANLGDGININDANDTTITNNLIGTTSAGNAALGNVGRGIRANNTDGTVIGGTGANDGNVIAASTDSGIDLGNATNAIIQGNYIGTDVTAAADLGNQYGIKLFGTTIDTLIGGTSNGAGNTVANSTDAGIYLNEDAGTGNSILGNSIFSNDQLGIELVESGGGGTEGVTVNDGDDADTGANSLQNYPVIGTAELSGSNLSLSGSLDTDNLAPTDKYRIEFFGITAGTNDATNGEGQYYLGATEVTVDVNGDATFSGVVLSGITLGVGDFVTATATEIADIGQVGVDDQLAYSDTSEFSANLALSEASETTSFQQGDVNSYSGTVDTFLNEGSVNDDNSLNVDLQVDLNDLAGDETTQTLIRFDSIFGTGPGQIPAGSTITSASLTVNVNNISDPLANITLHEMLATWSDTDTWFSTNGILLNDAEAAIAIDSTLADPSASGSVTFTGLASRIQSWLDGASSNNGWLISSDSTNGWDMDSSESANKPLLSVSYTLGNAAPAVTATGTQLAYTENDGQVIVDAGLTATDADSADLTGATVSIISGFAASEDTLAFTNQLGISGSYNAGTGILTLIGTTSVADYQTALRTITYQNSSEDPDETNRVIQFEVSDGAASGSSTRTVTVTAVNDAPTITSTAGTAASEGTLYTYTATVTDPDDANNGTDLTWSLSGAPAGMVVSSTGEVTWTPAEGVTTSGAVTLTVSDGNEDSAIDDTEVFTVTVAAINNAPTITSTAGTAATEDTLYTYTATVTDPDDANNGTDLTWSLSGAPAGMVVSSTGVVTWTPAEGVTTSGAVTLTVSDGNEDGAVDDTEVFTITVAAINNAPTITSTATTTATEDTLYTYSATVTDPDDANNGTDLTWSLSGAPAGMVVSSTGVVTWTPGEGVITSGAVTLIVSDGNEDGAVDATEVFTITVTAVNDAPILYAWYDDAWDYRKLITIDAAKVDATLTDFPVLITLAADAELAAFAQSGNGRDILFTASDGVTKLAHEFESYNATTGALNVWVKTDLSATDDTTLFMYYGNLNAVDQQDAFNVWNASYMGVWHLADTPTGLAGDINDSTANNNDGQTEGAMDAADSVAARIGKGLDFDEVDDLIRIPDSASLDSITDEATFELWVWFDNVADTDTQLIMSSSNRYAPGPVNGYEWANQANGDHFFYPYADVADNNFNQYSISQNPSYTSGQWHHLAATMDYAAKEAIVYLDGAPMDLTGGNEGVNGVNWVAQALTDDLLWGGNPDRSSRYFDGIMDELRVSDVARSQDWINTSVNNQSSPSTFFTLGGAESRDLTLTAINEDDTNPTGDTVAAILASGGGDRITDVDAGALEGIAVTAVDNSNGLWQYDETGGGSWLAFGTVDDTQAVLLDPGAKIRFVPNPDYSGATPSLGFRAWDQTSGVNGETDVNVSVNGDATAFSTAEYAAFITVNPGNDAPVATNDTYSVDEDTTLTVESSTTNLVDWWRFDEGGTSQTTADEVAPANDGTLGSTAGVDANDPTWSAGRIGAAGLNFDGADDYVTTTSTILKTATSFTLSAWFQTDTTAGAHHILWQGYAGGNGFGSPTPNDPTSAEMGLTVGSYDQNDKIVFFLGYDVPRNGADPIYIVSESNFTDTTQWHHVGVTFEDQGGGVFSASLYVDGVLEGTDTGTQNDRSQWGSLQIGAPDSATRLFDGEIDEVRIYDTALTPADLAKITQSGVLENDTDDLADILDAILVAGPSDGTLTLNKDGSFEYTPDADFSGSDSFTYKANDGVLDSNTATVNITVNPVNDAPVLSDDNLTFTNILVNATEPAGDLVSAMIASDSGNPIADVDAGAVEGIAVTAVDDINGIWQYSINGGATWTDFGSVTNGSAVLLGDGPNDRVRFVPAADWTGDATITFRAWDRADGNVSGATGINTGTGGTTTAFSSATDTANISVEGRAIKLLLSTIDDVGPAYSNPASGVPGLPSWSDGTVIAMRNSNINFGENTTSGTFVELGNFDDFAADGNAQLNGLHYLASDVTVAGAGIGGGSVDLLKDDILFITNGGSETLSTAAVGAPAGWTNNITTSNGEVYAFRAETPGDYSSGYFRLILNPATNVTTAITLVESNTTIGDMVVDKGDFLYAQDGNIQKNNIYWYDTSTATSFLLVNGDDIGIPGGPTGKDIVGIELVETGSNVGGVSLATGDILLTLAQQGTTLGTNNLTAQEQDIFGLNFSTTTFGSGTALASAYLFFDGDGNSNFDTNDEDLDAFSLIVEGVGGNQPPVISNSGPAVDFTEDGSPVIIDPTITVGDADSTDFDTGFVQVSITAGGATGDRLSIFNQGTAAGEIGVTGSNVTYNFGAGAVIIGTFTGGTSEIDPLVINLNASSDAVSTQALMQNITFWNTSDNPATAARTITFALDDGDGGPSNIIAQSATVTAVADITYAVDDTFGLDFDGVDDYVRVADSASLTMTNTMTMEAWIKPDASANTNRMIINKEGEYEVAIFSDNKIYWAFSNTDPGWGWHDTGYTVTNGEWTHIAVTYDNGTVTTYVNASVVDVYSGSGPIGDAHATLDTLRIGGRENNPAGQYFDGRIDDVRIWNVVRTEAEIQSNLDTNLIGNEAGLAGYWNFDENTGTAANDLTANNNDGVLTDAATTGAPVWAGYTTDQNTPLTIAAADGIVGNDFDADGDPLTVTLINGVATVGSLFTLPSDADVTVDSFGAFVYDPNGMFDNLAAGQSFTDSFTYQITDGNGNTDTATVYVTITGLNDAPTITSTAGTAATEDTLYTYTATVTDPDDANNGTDLTWSLSGAPAGMVVSSTGVVTWTPGEGVTTSGAVTLTVSDGNEDGAVDDTEVFTVTVTPVNDAPTITSTAGTTATEDTLYTYTAAVSDPDDANNGTDLTWSLSGAPTGMVVSSTGVVTWTPANGVTTSGAVTLTVSDGNEDGAADDTEVFTITVTPVNDAPTITSTAGTTASEDTLYTYTATVNDPDDANNGTDLTWSLSGAPTGMVVSSTGVVTWTPGEGVTTSGAVTLTVSDGNEDGAVDDTEVFTVTVTPVNDAPTITSTAGTTATEDTLYTYTAAVTDPDDANNGTDLTWSLSGAPTGMVVSSTGVVTWTPANGVTTSGAVTLTVSDGNEDGAVDDTEVFTITVTPVNDAPTITSTAGTTATEDTLYTYTATVTDPDDANNGTDLTWSLSGAPTGMVVSSTGVVTWTPGEGVTTSGAVTLTVSDGNEDGAVDDTEVFTVTVTPVNDAPTITSTAGTTATEDTLYTYTAAVSDPDDANNGTDLTWSLSGAPTGMVVSSTGVVTWTPGEGVTTSGAVTLTVSDGNEDGAVDDTEVFTVTVTPVNDAPTITSTAGTTATEDTLYTYTAAVSDPDDANNGTDLTWSLSGAPTGMVVSSTGVVTWTPANGVTTSGAVTLTVSDGNEDGAVDDTEVFTITVTPVNDAPTITSTAGTTATEDTLYTYTATVTDPDDANNGTDLTWSLSGAPAGMVVSSTGVVTWTPAEGVTTSGSVTLTVSDGNEDGAADDTEVFTITVTPVNDAPTITSTAPTTATEDTLYTYTAAVTDPDDANNGTDLTWSLSGAPTGMTVSSTGVVTWTPVEGVTTSGAVTLTVSDGNEDGAADDTEVFTITVTPVNDAPTITSTAGTTATEDTLYTYTPTVNDPDDANNGTDLTWSLSGAPTGMLYSNTGVVTWTPTEGVTTSGLVTLTVSDGNEDGAADATETFTITVTPVNDAPTITSTAGTTATEDSLYTYTATVTDPDDANNGTDLTWSLSGAPTGMVVSSTGAVTWTPPNGVTTSGAVTLIVSDGNEDGAVDDTEVFTITVTPLNDAPTITSTAGTAATEDTLYTYTATVDDPDDANNGTDLTWSLSGAPTGMVVSSTGVVTWTPLEGVTTSGAVTLTVSDGNEDGAMDDTETFTITVTPVNDAPTITSTAGTTATEDTLYTYTPTVIDPDDANNGTDLTWSLSGAPAGMVVSSTGVVTWTPAEGVATSGSVTLTVSDGNEDGAVDDTETFTITVTPVNDAPTITSTAGTTATEDTLYTYTAAVTDPDDTNNGTDLTWSLSGAPTGMTVSSTGVVTWTPANGVTTSGAVTLTVSDGNEDGAVDDTEVFTVTVTAVNDGPTITSTAGTTATEDTLYTYTATVSDPDDANNGTDLTWTLSGAPTGMVVSSTGVVTWTPGEGITTSGAVTLTVSDGNEDGAVDDTETFTITVTPVNDAPIITSTAGTTATEDSLYTYTPTVNDPDDANNGTDLTWSLSGAPTGMTVSSTGVVTWTPAEGVTTSGAVTLTVSDGNEDGAVDDTETFTITVTPVNDAPTITSTAGTTATEDTLYTYTATVTDPDDANNGTDLTWSLSGAPTGMTVSSTGVVTWTPLEGVTTSGAVTLTVSDGNEDGAVDDTETFTITVTPVNDAPTITSTAPTTATEDTLYTYTAAVTDPDDANNGTDLTWSLSGAPTGMTVSSTGEVTWTPGEGVTTSGAVTLTVSDGNEDGAVDDTETFTITVTSVNDAPTITSTAGTTATEDTLYTYTATVSDPDDANNGTDLTWSLSGAPTGMTVSSTGVVTWTPLEGVTTSGAVTLTVSDGNEDGAVDDTETFTITVTPVNDAPTITSTAGTTATEDTLYTYTATVTDPDDANNGTDLTWSLSGAPTGMTVSSTGVVTWTPAEGVTTSGAVTLTVSDGNEDGAVDDTETFTISVTSVNDAPTITSTAPTTATEDTLYTYTAAVTDPDDANNGTDLTWSLSGAPTGMTVSNTGVVTWTPTEGVTTSGAVTLTVSDGNEDGAVDDTETFTITVTPVNDAPTITSTAPTTATEDTLYTYTAAVTDPDDTNNGTDLTWSLSGAPTGMVVSSTGVVTWTPAEGVTTSGAVTLTVSDGNEDGAADDTETFTITVTPVNDAPTITSTAGTTATEDTLYTYTAAVTDPDDANNGTDLTWSLSGAPTGMVVSSTGVVTWTPGEGITTSGAVTLTVSDGNEDGAVDDTETFTITVTPVNDAPTITSAAPTTATEDTLYTYTAAVTDPDDANNGTDLTWSLSGAPTGMVVSSTGVVTWTPGEGITTSGAVTLTVSDGNEDGAVDDTETFTITVTPVNDAPTITSTAGTMATEDTLYTYTATVSDPDDANNGTDLTWSLSGAPTGMVVSSTGVVTWTPAEGVTTSGSVTLTVSDGNEDGAVDDTETFTITVTPVNDAPTITSTAGTTATEDTLYTYTATVSDPDDANNGTDLTWSLSGAPTGMVVSSTGVVTWTPTEGVTTSGAVTLTVSDGNEDGAVDATETFTITVTPVNDAPTITSAAGTTATEDTLYTYTATVTDPDDANNGTDLTWSLSGAPTGMVVSSTGVVTWTPAEGVTTSGAVTLTVSDGNENGAMDDTETFTITVTPVNDAPTITSTAGTTATEDTLYTYAATVTDPDDANNGTDLTWTLSGQPTGMVVSSTGVVTWTPGDGVTTSGPVTLTVSDGNEDGAADDTETFTITVTPVNDAPIITSTAGTSATEDTLYTYTPTVNDPDDANNGTDLTWSLSGAPTGMVVSSTGVVTWTPGEGVTSSGAVTLTVSDGNEDGAMDASETFTITVTPVNDAPTITSTAGTTATEDSLYTYTATVTDPDDANNGTDLTWSLSGAPAGMVVSSTGVVTWTPAEGVTTSGAVTLTVSDGNEDGAVDDTEVFTVTVTPVNDAPIITSTAGTTATEDTLYTYTPTVNDPDDANNGTDLTWSLSGAPAGMAVSTTGVVTWTPGEGVTTSGSVTLTVSDGNEDGAVDDTETFTITVTPVNDAPTITSTAPTTATEDTLYTYTATVTDPDDANNGTDLTWSLSGQPTGMVVSSTGVVTWTPGEGVTTSGAVTLTVSDGNEDGAVDDTETFTVTVTPVNDAPIITSTAGTIATEDTLYTYAATVSDPDDANNGTDLTWSLSGAPAGMVVSSTGVVTWTPAEGVTTSGAVTLTVSDGNEDGAMDDTETFTVTVTPVNDAPTITSTAATTATEETLYTYAATVSDPDDANNGIDLTWSLSGAPAGMVVSSTGVVTWTPAEGVTTSGAVTLTVSDGNEDGAADDTETFTITVTPVNDAPTITSTAGTTATEDTLYTYTATVSDPDDANNGTDLTWTLSGAPTGMVVSSTGVVTWTPGEGVTSSGAVTLTVSDGNEDGAMDDTETFTVTVTPVNDAPTITSTAGTTATEETLYTYTATVNDPDDANNGTDLTWSLSGAPAGMVVSSTGVVTWTPAEGVTTSGAVTLTVSDGNEDGAVDATETFTVSVTPMNDAPTGSVTISGTPTEGQILTASNTLADPDGLGTITYQWQRGGVNIAGATGDNYTLVEADVGRTIRVVASYIDGGGNSESVNSAGVVPTAKENNVPGGTVTLSGTPTEDEVLTADTSGLSDDDGLGTFTYQWFRDNVLVAGATGSSYTLGDADVDTRMRVEVAYTDAAMNSEGPLSSAPTAPIANVNDAPTGAVLIDNMIPELGTTLAASNTLADADGLSGEITYQWQRDGVDIAGATGTTYTTVAADVDTTISVVASYTDDRFTLEIETSAPTSSVVDPNPAPEPEPEPEPVPVPEPESPETEPSPPSPKPEFSLTSTQPVPTEIDVAQSTDEATATPAEDNRVAGSSRGNLPQEAPPVAEIPEEIQELIDAGPPVADETFDGFDQTTIAEEPVNTAITTVELQQIGTALNLKVELQHVKAVLNNPDMWRDIDAMKKQMDETEVTEEEFVVQVISTSGVGLMAGLVAYGLRGGALVASLLSTVPLWSAYDPLPILSTKNKKKDKDITDSDEAPEKVNALFE